MNLSSISPYLPIRRITGGHKKSIQCLAFSEIGSYLASASEEGTLVIWKTDDGLQVSSFQLESPPLCLAWDCQRTTRLFIGCLDGTAGCIDKFEGPFLPIMTGIFRTPIYALAVDRATSPCRIALAAGPEIHLATPINNGEYFATVAILPKPTDLPAVPMKRGDVRIRGRSLHFTNNGRNLLVSYLNHGIVCWDIATLVRLWQIIPDHTHSHIGFSSVSPNEMNIAISNLSTGIDIYSLKSLKKTHTLADDITAESNYPLSVEFLAEGRFVTAGSHSGRVRIWDRESGGIFQTLEHDNRLVKCIAASELPILPFPCLDSSQVGFVGDTEFLAVASAQEEPYIQLWISRQKRRFRLQNITLNMRFRIFETFHGDLRIVITAFVIVSCAFFLAIPPGSTYGSMICNMTLDYLLTFVMVVKDTAKVIESVLIKALNSTREHIRRVLWEWLQPPLPPAQPPKRFLF